MENKELKKYVAKQKIQMRGTIESDVPVSQADIEQAMKGIVEEKLKAQYDGNFKVDSIKVTLDK